MVRIIKTMQAKHLETLSPFLDSFRSTACSISLSLLPQHLASFPTGWPFPRGDLYHWISVLNRFDVVLENFCKTYELDQGPQTRDFQCSLLESKAGETEKFPAVNLEELGFGSDGDRQLVESILAFSRMLLKNCGNRSLYASSAHLNNLLQSTSLSIIESTLSLGAELAQRYQAAIKRHNSPRHATLQSHYNFDLDRVNQLALPFTKIVTRQAEPAQPATPTTPSAKGKEKVGFNSPMVPKPATTTTVYASDLVSMVKGNSGNHSSPKTSRNGGLTDSPSDRWDEWGEVKVTVYPKAIPETESTVNNSPRPPVSSSIPTTPTPIRRASNLGPNGQRASRALLPDDSPSTPSRSSGFQSDEPRPTTKTIHITSAELSSVDLHNLVQQSISQVPQAMQFELFTKLRVAKALTTSSQTRQQILTIRLLAISNLAYIHPEPIFLQDVLKQDSDEPRRFQLAYQLAELVHPPSEGGVAVPRSLQTIAFTTLDALAVQSTKYADVCGALNTNVNHGVLLYVVRKAVAEMTDGDPTEIDVETEEWREALFAMINNLCMMHRTGGDLVTAGLIPILVEILSMRTPVAERYHPKVLSFLDTIMYSARDAFQTLVSADGLDAVSDLIVYEVTTASTNVDEGKGIPEKYRSANVDYQIPFFQQQTLKWLFKFIHHMMTTAGGYGGNFDRLLRNLIDSSALLASLRLIIENSRRFGSVVWTNAVSILNDFINNEPTSFAVIAEAGLSRALLEAVTCTTINVPTEALTDTQERPQGAPEDVDEAESPPSTYDEDNGDSYDGTTPERPSLDELLIPREGPLARGILPTSETISMVPQAFGAICLNNAGMKMFQESRALDSFFEIFESPEHVKCMETNKDLASNLGSTFDELVRHHPPLKRGIMNAILNMVVRVSSLCKVKGVTTKIGAKLWTVNSAGKVVIADQELETSPETTGKGKNVEADNDVEMRDADTKTNESAQNLDEATTISMTPYVTAVSTFLSAIFSNSAVRSDFSSQGGIDFVLDLADSPCLTSDFADNLASRNLHGVIALLAEQKPHLTMPSLLRRAQAAVDVLIPFVNHNGPVPFFQPFIDREARASAKTSFLADGTNLTRALVNVHSLVSTLHSCFQTSAYNHRSANTTFTQLNLSDYYVRLVNNLGPLLGACCRELSGISRFVLPTYPHSSAAKYIGSDDTAADILGASFAADPLVADNPGSEAHSPAPTPQGDLPSGDASALSAPTPLSAGEASVKKPLRLERDSLEFKNFGTLQKLLSKLPRSIVPFFQTLGKGLVSKRSGPDGFQRQGHSAIADALAESILRELPRREYESDLEYPMHRDTLLRVLKDMLIDVSRHNERPIQTITLVLHAFTERGGFDVTNKMLEDFSSDVLATRDSGPNKNEQTNSLKVMAMGSILSLYNQIVNGKNVSESIQTLSMNSRDNRHGHKSSPFSPPQFLVELRMAVLPVIRRLWESELIEVSGNLSEKLVEVLRTITTADCESGAVKRSEKAPAIVKPPRKTFQVSIDHLTSIVESETPRDLAIEALFRCNNNLTYAMDYCRAVTKDGRPRYPVPEGDIAPTPSTTPVVSRPFTPADTSMALDNSSDSNPSTDQSETDVTPAAGPQLEQVASPNLDGLASTTVLDTAETSQAHSAAAVTSAASSSAPPETEEAQAHQVTIDDLNDERSAIRENLIDKCLDVINAHGNITFEICDLITTVVTKSPDPTAQRKVVGETLVIALMSFAGEESIHTSGNKVAAYAHLLALLLRDKQFYAATIDELKDNLSTLLTFVKLSPNHSADEPSPWIAHILLIVEMLLSEDARPIKASWTSPKDETEEVKKPVFEPFQPAVPEDDRAQLLEGILEILPRIGKDEGLALAVLRILVILTRTRSIAQAMGEKKNIQRLFVMAKQLAGTSSTSIQSPLMLILRHIIEDEDTIKQIMRSDIKSFFETGRQSRTLDVSAYVRGLSHTSLRAPELFVDVSNEMVKYGRWQYNNPESTSRANTLILKDAFGLSPPKPTDSAVQPTVQATEDLTLQDVKPSTEGIDTEMQDVGSKSATEQKLPVVEKPDGVIHFLLCELLNYRDVEDKDIVPTMAGPVNAEKSTLANNGDTEPVNGPSPSTEEPASSEGKVAKTPKQEFKSEDHPIYLYRCFLLQCLTELLASYNRTKIEFINFKRSAPQLAMTPSKPRSSVVNYLLFDLIPVGTMEQNDSMVFKKKAATSSWADSVLTALLAKTGEQLVDKTREQSESEDEPDLLFVRKFVLENILKAYKEASSSNDPLDSKYARMFSLAELMNHIMSGKETIGATDTSIAKRSQTQLQRLMFEKGFIASLTASIADVDLNFPGAKRAVKHILRPLKTLTNTAIILSDRNLISSSPGQAGEDEIESATSVSDPEEDREETPDLFRNSTLGMFEPGREEDSTSESEDDDEEMYDEGYPDEMEYDEEPEDDEDNISEDDEEVEGMGPIEGLSGDHGIDVEVIMGDDDDDDEDDEDDSGDEDEDDDHDSEDDDAHIEIIDEAGNIQQIAADDNGEDWEDEDEDIDEDDGEEIDYEAEAQDQDEAEMQAMADMDMAGGPLGDLVRALGGGAGAVDIMERMEEQMDAEAAEHGEEDEDDEDRIGADYGEDDEEDDEEGDDMDEDMFLEQGYPGDGAGAVFGWEGEVDPPIVVHRGHHHRPRHAFPSPFPFLPGGPRDPLGGESDSLHEQHQDFVPPIGHLGVLSPEEISLEHEAVRDLLEQRPSVYEIFLYALHMRGSPVRSDLLARLSSDVAARRLRRANGATVPDFGRSTYRSHRPGQVNPRSMDDGTNPLLQRHGAGRANRDGPGRTPSATSWIQAMGPPGSIDMMSLSQAGGPFGESPTLAALREMIRTLPDLPGHLSRHGHLQFSFTAAPGHELPPEISAFLRTSAPRAVDSRFTARRDTNEPGNAGFFTPQSTAARWTEEAKMIFGLNYHEKAADLKAALESLLVPPAIEADKLQKAAEQERLRKLEEEAKKKQEEERIAKEAKEAEEKIAREKKEAEEREAAELAAAEARAARGDGSETMDAETGPAETAPDAMEGVEAEGQPAGSAAQAEEAAADRPRVTTVIRGNPFDITDLDIDPEFLTELPEELREEVIMSRVAERRSQAVATGGQPSEIDQEFLNALPEDIRDEIMQQERQDRRRRERDEQRRQQAAANGGPPAPDMDAASILATLPPALRQQVLMEQDEEMLNLLPPDMADQARAAQREHPAHPGRRVPSGSRRIPSELQPPVGSRAPRRAIVQMLDKSGIATLLRLMFTFQHTSLRQALNSVLENISLNRVNRTEVLSTLLNVLQEGSMDIAAVERSFAHLSLRAKQPKETKDPKTPQPLKRTFTGMSGSVSLTQTSSEASPLMVVQQCLSALTNLTQRNQHVPAFFLTEHESLTGLKRSMSRKGKGKDSKAHKFAINSLLSLLDRDLIMESSLVMELLSTLLSAITAPLQTMQRKQKEAEEAKKTEAAAQAASAVAPAEATNSAGESSVTAAQEPAAVPANSESVQAIEGDASEVNKSETAPVEPEKKPRTFLPPTIPEENLKLVINIFVAGECSSRTFRETLSTIKNLSAIPGAKTIFGRELINKAQGLGAIILTDLEELLPQIQKATTGTEIQGVALARFSPGGSDQKKLLQVLTALDHLFDPKNEKMSSSDAEADGDSSQLMEKQDLLSSLYQSSTFGPMWEKLSVCLSAIRQRDQLLNVATILLPLIEALMVVCKNTTVKDAPARGQDLLLTSPPPDSGMESLFFTFTEEHRKILNDLVRQTPKLMSGTFRLLVKNPKVLEFDNKRNYFSRSIHAKNSTTRQTFPPLQISCRRDAVFHDSFKHLYFKTGDEMKYGKLSIRFHGEEGVDAGGVTREWFQVLARQMFDADYVLFIPVSSDRTTFHPNQLSSVNEEHLLFFKFIGRIIGKALYESRVLDCHFSRAVYKRILGKSVSVKDMESLDPDYYKSLIWMLENDITDVITETFSVDNDKFGVVETIDFVPNGRNIPVTEENKHEYVRLMVEWKLTGSVKEQLDEFLKGFHEIIPAELVSIFNEQELELLISGLPEIDVDDWKSNTEYHNYSASSPQIQWFWRAVRSFDKEERAKLLQFVTGTSKVPLNGFKELEGMNGFSRFNIHRDYGNKERLPSSHTCFNQLDLPEYENYEALRSHVLTAITAGSDYFGFA